ncbi:hypothetical protein Tco_0870271, partial [Tanacetum coccineum]
MMVQATKDMSEDSVAPTDSYFTPIHTQPSSSKPQKKKSRRKQRKDSGLTEPIPDEAIATPSCDPPQSGEDRMQLTELMDLCTQLRELKNLTSLSIILTIWRMRLKHGRKIADLDADAKEKEVAKKEVSTVEKEATTANAPTTTIDELTLAQTLIEINAAKPKVVTSAATTTITTRPKARGVVVQEPCEFKTTSSPLQASQLPHAKDKGKAIMVEPKRPLKKKDQVALDEEMPRNLEAQMQAELIEEERLA